IIDSVRGLYPDQNPEDAISKIVADAKRQAAEESGKTVEEIEEHNILNATYFAMNRAIEGLSTKADYALIDGNRVPTGISVPCETVVKGDFKSCSIAAASILAKVSRDNLMLEYAEKYPEYNFKKHKGYGTAEHIALIKEHGLSPIHRPSFLRKILL
ncbi:MAG: ribonuclease HII, partial [Clostridia bacterium]|nr:ribonuclease HII [Clostridia bacterium]